MHHNVVDSQHVCAESKTKQKIIWLQEHPALPRPTPSPSVARRKQKTGEGTRGKRVKGLFGKRLVAGETEGPVLSRPLVVARGPPRNWLLEGHQDSGNDSSRQVQSFTSQSTVFVYSILESSLEVK